jgi:hypothetical protein
MQMLLRQSYGKAGKSVLSLTQKLSENISGDTATSLE